MKTIVTNNAEKIYSALNGIFVLYKPALSSVRSAKNTILKNISEDLNKLKVRDPIKYVEIEETQNRINVHVRPSFADHIAVTGPRFQVDDMQLKSTAISRVGSGVLLCGINSGIDTLELIKRSKPTKFYRIKGVLGIATDNFHTSGRIIEKSTWKFIKRDKIDYLCSDIQSLQQRMMFRSTGIDIQSQAAYDMAVKGPLRPSREFNAPLVYSMKCIDFTPPEFVIELVCVNEDDTFLMQLIHYLGTQLHSTACVSKLQLVKYGLFDVQMALLSNYWNLENVLKSISQCRDLVERNPQMLDANDPTYQEVDEEHQRVDLNRM